jgi:hypothetical protein
MYNTAYYYPSRFQNETIFLSPRGAMGLKGREAAATAAEPPESPVFCG